VLHVIPCCDAAILGSCTLQLVTVEPRDGPSPPNKEDRVTHYLPTSFLGGRSREGGGLTELMRLLWTHPGSPCNCDPLPSLLHPSHVEAASCRLLPAREEPCSLVHTCQCAARYCTCTSSVHHQLRLQWPAGCFHRDTVDDEDAMGQSRTWLKQASHLTRSHHMCALTHIDPAKMCSAVRCTPRAV
jgi:hypothetical protein